MEKKSKKIKSFDKNGNREKNLKNVVEEIVEILPSNTDPDGSYTGKPFDENQIPVQDADDL